MLGLKNGTRKSKEIEKTKLGCSKAVLGRQKKKIGVTINCHNKSDFKVAEVVRVRAVFLPQNRFLSPKQFECTDRQVALTTG
jgi:hypothetical protein